jgi:ribosomal protein S27E
MSPRTRYNILPLISVGIGFPLLVTTSHISRSLTIVLVVLLGVGFASYSMSIRCPKCRKQVGMAGIFRTPFAPRRCRECGQDLTIDPRRT